MSSPGAVSWVFKPEAARSHTPAFAQPAAIASSATALWSPLNPTSTLSAAASQSNSSPATPSSALTRLDLTPHRAAPGIPISPQGSAGSLGTVKMASSQNLLLPLMPSTEDSVSGLRFALQEARLNVDSLNQQVNAQPPAAACQCAEPPGSPLLLTYSVQLHNKLYMKRVPSTALASGSTASQSVL